MLAQTPINFYDLTSGKPTKTFKVPELTTRGIGYLPELKAVLVLSAGQHKVYTLGDRPDL